MTKATHTRPKRHNHSNVQFPMKQAILLVLLVVAIPLTTTHVAVTFAFQQSSLNYHNTIATKHQSPNELNTPFMTIKVSRSTSNTRYYATTIKDTESSKSTRTNDDQTEEPKKQQQSLSDRIASSSMASAAAVATAAGTYSFFKIECWVVWYGLYELFILVNSQWLFIFLCFNWCLLLSQY